MQLLIFAAACFAGQTLQTTTGFGLNLVVMALASTVLPVTPMAAACTLVSLVTNIYFVIRWREKINFPVLSWPLASMLAFSALAILTVRWIPMGALKGALGLVLIAMSVSFLVFGNRMSIRASRTGGLLTGSLAGVLAGYFSTASPPLAAYFLGVLEDEKAYLATIQTVFLVSNVWTTALRGAVGLLNGQVAALWAAGCGGAALGILLGLRLLGRMNFTTLRTIAYWAIGASGAWLTVSAWLL